MTIPNASTVESQNISHTKIVNSISTSSKNHKESLKDDLCGHISTVFHTLICGFTVYILWLCFKDNQTWSLVTWHVFLYTLGWALFMTEGLLILTKENIYSKRISYLLRVRFHWIIETFALIFSLAGFICIFCFKVENEGSHFHTNHALYGLIAIIFSLPTCLTGLFALFNIELKRYIKPVILKLVHAVCGIVTLVMGGITMIFCLFSKWFQLRTQDSDFAFYTAYVILVSTFLWCIFRPTITSLQRIRGLISK